MDVRDAEPAELTFMGIPFVTMPEMPPNMMMLVVPKLNRFQQLDYAETVKSSVLIENVGQA